jgi:regulator of RNase E activity RraA
MHSPTLPGVGTSSSVIGKVTTIKMVHSTDKISPALATGSHYADLQTSNNITLISTPPSLPNQPIAAACGGLIALRSQKLSVTGIVIDGFLRDLHEIQQLGLPVFARGTAVLGSGGSMRASEVDVPVRLSRPELEIELWIHPGDVMVGDWDGVVCVPKKLATDVANLCAERQKMDEKVQHALREGRGMGEAVAEFRR